MSGLQVVEYYLSRLLDFNLSHSSFSAYHSLFPPSFLTSNLTFVPSHLHCVVSLLSPLFLRSLCLRPLTKLKHCFGKATLNPQILKDKLASFPPSPFIPALTWCLCFQWNLFYSDRAGSRRVWWINTNITYLDDGGDWCLNGPLRSPGVKINWRDMDKHCVVGGSWKTHSHWRGVHAGICRHNLFDCQAAAVISR